MSRGSERGGGKIASPMSPMLERLGKTAGLCTNLSSDLEGDVRRRRTQDDGRIDELRELVTRMEKNIAMEISRRTESTRVLQSLIETQIAGLSDSVDKRVSDRFHATQLTAEVLGRRISSLEKETVQDREKRDETLDDTSAQLSTDIQGLHDIFDGERVQRLEREGAVRRQVAEEATRAQEAVEAEKKARDASFAALRNEIDQYNGVREKEDAVFRTRVMEEIEVLRGAIRMEAEAREVGLEQLASTVNDVVTKLKEGLRIVAQK